MQIWRDGFFDVHGQKFFQFDDLFAKMFYTAKLMSLHFPTLPHARWHYTSVNAEWLEWKKKYGDHNLLHDPRRCQQMIDDMNERLRHTLNDTAIETYGGYEENRNDVWQGFLQDGRYVHMGIDYNVKAGTPLATSSWHRIVYTDGPTRENTTNDFWGNRIILEQLDDEKNALPQAPLLMCAHLRKITQYGVNDLLPPNVRFAEVGSWEGGENGGWYEHLHFQAVLRHQLALLFAKGDKTYSTLFGYVRPENVHKMRILYPDGRPYLEVRQAA
jgi:hypothetical protein